MRLTRPLFAKVAKLIDTYSNYNPSPLSLKKFADFGIKTLSADLNQDHAKKLEIQSYEFLKEELLVRLALMTREMLYLPDRLIKTSSVTAVHSW
jgi:pyruvate dehydrogenase kinase 2/3/4